MALSRAVLVLQLLSAAIFLSPAGAGIQTQHHQHADGPAAGGDAAAVAAAAHAGSRAPTTASSGTGGAADYGGGGDEGGAEAHRTHHRLQRRHRRSGGRCAGTVGSWCGGYHMQPPIPFKQPPILGKPCPGSCSGIGVCHGDTGRCDCPAGAGGPACADHVKRPCTKNFRSPRDSLVPNSHIGPDKRDLDWSLPESTYSRWVSRSRRRRWREGGA